MNTTVYSLIFNPTAGRLRQEPQLIDLVESSLNDAGVATTRCETKAPGDAADFAREAVRRGDTMVIVCGGDGTINEAAQALVGTSTALAVWPGGTSNVLARELRLPDDPEALAEMIAVGTKKAISVGKAFKPSTGWNRYFLLMAGIGLDAAIVRGVNPTLKRKTGVGAFWLSALNYLARFPMTPFSVGIGSEHFESTFACIANAASYGGWFSLAPDASLDENRLDVCLFNTRHRAGLLRDALMGLNGSHRSIPSVVYKKATAAYANSNNNAPVHLDGEYVGTLPMRFESIPDALNIIVPESGSGLVFGA